MKKYNLFNLGVLLLGISIGIIITSITFYYNPTIKYKDYTYDQIAQKYTEIKLKEQRQKEENKKIDFTIKEEESLDEILNNLHKSNIIKDKKDFSKYLKSKKAIGKIQHGTYQINLPITHDDLINEIIGK